MIVLENAALALLTLSFALAWAPLFHRAWNTPATRRAVVFLRTAGWAVMESQALLSRSWGTAALLAALLVFDGMNLARSRRHDDDDDDDDDDDGDDDDDDGGESIPVWLPRPRALPVA